MGNFDPECEQKDWKNKEKKNNQFEVSDKLLARFGPCIMYWYQYHKTGKKIDTEGKSTDSIAQNFVRLLLNDGKEPNDTVVKSVDITLILYGNSI